MREEQDEIEEVTRKIENPSAIAMAAIRAPDGRVFSVARPGRHHNVIEAMFQFYGLEVWQASMAHDQGFVTFGGRFVGREEAAALAIRAKQLLARAPTAGGWGAGLFSEDVW